MNSNGIRSSLEPLDIEEDRVDDGVTAYAGLPIVIDAWYAFGLDKVCQEELRLRKRQSGLSDAQWAEVPFVPGEKVEKKGKRPFRYVGIRIPKDEPYLFEGAYEYYAVVTNRWDMEANELLNWQRKCCGTVEWGA